MNVERRAFYFFYCNRFDTRARRFDRAAPYTRHERAHTRTHSCRLVMRCGRAIAAAARSHARVRKNVANRWRTGACTGARASATVAANVWAALEGKATHGDSDGGGGGGGGDGGDDDDDDDDGDSSGDGGGDVECGSGDGRASLVLLGRVARELRFR